MFVGKLVKSKREPRRGDIFVSTRKTVETVIRIVWHFVIPWLKPGVNGSAYSASVKIKFSTGMSVRNNPLCLR